MAQNNATLGINRIEIAEVSQSEREKEISLPLENVGFCCFDEFAR